MYGTVARIKVKPGMLDQLRAVAEENEDSNPREGVMLVFQMDNDPDELFMVVAAPDEETYRRQSEDPKQHQRFLKMMEFLAAEPEWHDGTVIDSRL